MSQSSPDGVVLDKIIAKVDDYIVLKSELERSYLDYLQQGRVRSEQAKCEILESLIVNKMLVARAEIDSVLVQDAEVQNNLQRRIEAIMQSVGGSRKQLEEAYGKTIEQIESELFEAIKEQMLVQRMQEEITVGMEVTPREVKKFFGRIHRDSLPYFSTEVQVAQIVREPKPSATQVRRAREKIMEIKELIEADVSTFETQARRYSEDGSANQGGELPIYKRGEVDPAFEAAAMTLEPGVLSEPVESQFGYHLIEVIWRRGNTFKTRHILVTAKPAVEDFLLAEDYLDSLRTQILNDSIEFQAAAKEYSHDQITSSNGGFFSDQQTGSIRVAVEALSPDIFFAIDTMKIGAISKPMRFQKQDGTYAYRILYYKEKIPPHLANLDRDYQKIALAALASKRNEKLNTWFLDAKDGIFIEIDTEYDHCNLIN